uniref:Uncharacterized protein n=1 Tax=uncultured Bacteroidota bacterium TaxID=152509 RepID=H5SB17_9BACT|nr:hypothetical protein HGMM_F06F04C34 [uncultured Bacteroidetes bacterium]
MEGNRIVSKRSHLKYDGVAALEFATFDHFLKWMPTRNSEDTASERNLDALAIERSEHKARR